METYAVQRYYMGSWHTSARNMSLEKAIDLSSTYATHAGSISRIAPDELLDERDALIRMVTPEAIAASAGWSPEMVPDQEIKAATELRVRLVH